MEHHQINNHQSVGDFETELTEISIILKDATSNFYNLITLGVDWKERIKSILSIKDLLTSVNG